MNLLERLLDDRVLEILDTEGRRLGEQAASDPPPTELRVCPWSGARQGGEMNVTAWKQVRRHWPGVLSTLSRAAGPTAADVWRGLGVLRWQPLGMDEPVSAEVAATFKTALGLQRPLTSWLLLDPSLAAGPIAAVCPEDQLLERLSEEGWLLGHRQVCAGPPERIVEAWRALGQPATDGLGDTELGDSCVDLVVGAWAILGATRQVIVEGRLREAPGWSAAGQLAPGLPEVLGRLRARGPTALVREVPRFEPEWARHVYSEVPERVEAAVVASREALGSSTPLAALDRVWHALSAACRI